MLSSITKHGLEVLIGVTNLAEAAYGGVRTAGWHYVELEDLGVPDRYIDETGHFFVNGEAAACVLTNDEGRVVVSFRGKDSAADWNDFPKVEDGTYIDYFMPLLVAVAGAYTSESIVVTGHSLGGATVHQLSELVDELGLQGPLADARYVSVSSPIFWNDDVFSFGYQNDPAYGLADGVNAPDVANIYWYDDEVYVIDGQNYYPAHDLDNIAEGLERIIASDMFGAVVDLENPIVIDGVNGPTFVGLYAPGAEPAYYLGVDHWFVKGGSLPVFAHDVVFGRNAVDNIDGMGGRDALAGLGGGDRLHGGDAADRLWGGTGQDELSGGFGADALRGGLGGDAFVFDQNDDGGDVVLDFHAAAATPLPGQEDQIAISTEAFGGDPGDVVVVSGCRLPDSSEGRQETVFYAARTGEIVYDPDGTGPQDGTLIATLEDGPRILQADDILLF